jgi:septal ring factor EnvC (AmiA/AmiB activator)
MTPSTHNISIKYFLLLLFLSLISSSTIAAPADAAQASELESIRTRIKDVETRIKSAQNETDKLQKELRDNEVTTAKTLTRLHDIESSIAQKNAELEELRFEQAEHDAALNKEKEKLTRQIRAAYQIGRNDYIKLILNQENPALVGRALAYYDYHNRARSERIKQVKQTLIDLEQVQTSIKNETTQLESLKTEHEAKLSDFYQYRATRKDISTRLKKYIAEQGVELQTLQENERELGVLFQDLKEEKAVTIEMYEDMPPFNTLKGKLNWPVKGKLVKRYGASKKGANLKWQGVLIDAETGTRVNAISTGKIVFADWFRNLGLLIIIDHGDGFMSLYGHNQNLLKNTGDWVLAGEQIATVGDSGGQSDTALYFEIRKGAEPLNPSHWCKR